MVAVAVNGEERRAFAGLPRENGRDSRSVMLEGSPRAHRPAAKGWGHAWLPLAFVAGALLTLCVVFLTNSSVGVRWQGAPAARSTMLDRKFGPQGGAQADDAPSGGDAALECPEPEPCPDPVKCPKPEPPDCPDAAECPPQQDCPVCERCPALPPAPAPCPACAEQQLCAPCPKQPACPKPQPPKCPDPPPQQPGGGAAGAAGGAPALRPLRMPWEPLVAASEVRRALYYGSGARLEAVVARLLAGEPIRAYTLGGSVTKGSGSSEDAAAYPGRFFEFLNTTFPHKDHVLVNKGVGATSSGIFTACIEHMLPNGADLVVLEFTMNETPDLPFTEPQRRGYEQLVRKLLRMPGPPALLQLHHWSWWRAAADGVDDGLFYFPSTEADLYVMSQYYDIPSVSLRGAAWHLMQNRVQRFNVDKATARHKKHVGPTGYEIPHSSKKDAWRYFYYDRTHPNDQGHQVLAELLAGAVLAAAERVQRAAVADGSSWAEAGWAEERRDAALRALPQPMIPANDDAPSTLCAMQEEFKDIIVDHSPGFEYVADRPQEETFVGQKWGWTSDEPGEWAELQFDSRPDVNTSEGDGRYAIVYLSHLKSYEGMGTAWVRCVSGCKCNTTVLDGTWEMQATLMQNLKFKVSPSAKCRLRVTVRKEAGEVPQQGHKVKLMAIMASHFPLRLNQKEDQTEVVAGHVEVR